jgi:hypothetical protein
MGSHAELLSQRGHYYRLYTQQFRYEQQAYGSLSASAPAINVDFKGERCKRFTDTKIF